FVLFKHAAQLSKKTGIPWVADYRDCWTNNLQVMASKPPQRWLHTCYFRFFEKKIVRTARLITTAAPSYQAALRELFKKQPIAVVYNGSDPKQLAPLADEQAPVFTLSYAGIFYPHQALEMFLQGLAQFKHEFP